MENSSLAGGAGAGIVVVSIGKRVFGLSAQSGRVMWEYDELPQEPRIEVVGDHVMACALGHIVRLRCSDGRVMWKHTIGFSMRTLLCTDDRILVGGFGEVACYRHDGTLLWHEPFKGKGCGDVALAVPGKASQIDHTS